MILFTFFHYQVFLGHPLLGEPLQITKDGAQPVIIHDDTAGTYVFWFGNYWDFNKTINVARIENDEAIEQKTIFGGDEDADLEELTVVCDNSGFGFVFIGDYYCWDTILILNLRTLEIEKTLQTYKNFPRYVSSARSSVGRILVQDYFEDQVFAVYSDGSYERLGAEIDGKIEYYKDMSDQGLLVVVNETTKNYYGESRNRYDYFLRKYDTNGKLLGKHVFGTTMPYEYEVFELENGEIIYIWENWDGDYYYKYKLFEADLTLKKTAVFDNTYHESTNFNFKSEEFDAKGFTDEFVLSFISPGIGFFVNVYDLDFNLKYSYNFGVSFKKLNLFSIEIEKPDEIEFVFIDHQKSYNPEKPYIFSGKIIYLSSNKENYTNYYLIFLLISFIYSIIATLLYFRNYKLKADLEKFKTVAQYTGSSSKTEKAQNKSDDKTIQRLKDAKNSMTKGNLLMDFENIINSRKIYFNIIIILTLIIFIIYLFYSMITWSYWGMDFEFIFLKIISVFLISMFIFFTGMMATISILDHKPFKFYENCFEYTEKAGGLGSCQAALISSFRIAYS